MRSRLLLAAFAAVLVAGSGGEALAGGGNSEVTRDDVAMSYLRYDGSSDDTTAACSTGRRSQNEPTVAVDPHNTRIVTAGANDYCAAIVNGDVWSGYFFRSEGIKIIRKPVQARTRTPSPSLVSAPFAPTASTGSSPSGAATSSTCSASTAATTTSTGRIVRWSSCGPTAAIHRR